MLALIASLSIFAFGDSISTVKPGYCEISRHDCTNLAVAGTRPEQWDTSYEFYLGRHDPKQWDITSLMGGGNGILRNRGISNIANSMRNAVIKLRADGVRDIVIMAPPYFIGWPQFDRKFDSLAASYGRIAAEFEGVRMGADWRTGRNFTCAPELWLDILHPGVGCHAIASPIVDQFYEPVPEPSTALLFMLGILIGVLVAKR